MKSKNIPDAIIDAASVSVDKKPVIPADTFTVGERKYVYAMPSIWFPELGKRTALEAISDDVKYHELDGKTINEFLVSIGSGAVKEI